MSFDERLIYLLLGIGIGFILGYIVASIREIKEKVAEVNEKVGGRQRREMNDHGFMRFPIIADFALVTVVMITVWAAFASQKASNEVKDTQDQLARVSHCNYVVFGAFLAAVDDRNTTFKAALHSNVELQKSWYDFVKYQLHLPPYPEVAQRAKANKYADYLKSFLDLSEESEKKAAANPYPTKRELSNCVYNKE